MRTSLCLVVLALMVGCSNGPAVCTNCKGWCEMNDMRRDGPEYTWTEDNTPCVCECDE